MVEAGINPAPKRRWFAFSLQAFFVVFTLGSILLAWTSYQFSWIRQRHDAFRQQSQMIRNMDVPEINKSPSAPSTLWLFGETGIGEIWCRNLPPDDADKIREFFPEADVVEFNGGSPMAPPWW